MSKRLFTYLLVGAFVVAGLAPAANAACLAKTSAQVAVHAAPPTLLGDPGTTAPTTSLIALTNVAANNPDLNNEGLTERVSDVVIYDDGVAPNCFQSNQTIRLTYNVKITVPDVQTTPITSATAANFDVYDSAGPAGLVITAASTVGLAPGGTPQTVITVTVLQAGTVGDPTTTTTGAAFRIKNLRADATSLDATTVNNLATVTTSDTIPGALITVDAAAPPATVGTVFKTIAAGGAVTAIGSGPQSSGAALTTQATFAFAEGFNDSFRLTGAAGATVLNDIATNATSLILDAGTTVPSGVAVSFPSSMIVSNATPGNGIVFTLRTGGSCSGPAACFAIYDATKNDATGAFTLTVDTAAASSPGTFNTTTSASVDPKIGVTIGSPSGSGSVALHAFFGPAGTTGGGNDDVNASAVPRYVASNTTGTQNRQIFNAKATTTANAWFNITAVRTALLFPFTSTTGGFNTGVSVANTCADKAAFGAATDTCTQSGPLAFYFFPTGGTPFSLSSDLANGGTALPNCRGLDANGRLTSGGIFACGLTALLTAAGQTGTFDGYMIVVTQFNNAHGFSAQFNASGNPYAANNALVLGSGTRNGSISGAVESLGN